MRKMTAKYFLQAHEQNKNPEIFFKNLDLLYHFAFKIMVLGLYECILKCTLWHATCFCHVQKGRECLLRGDNFLQQLRRSEVCRACRETVAVAKTERLSTHTEKEQLSYSCYSPAALRVIMLPEKRLLILATCHNML